MQRDKLDYKYNDVSNAWREKYFVVHFVAEGPICTECKALAQTWVVLCDTIHTKDQTLRDLVSDPFKHQRQRLMQCEGARKMLDVCQSVKEKRKRNMLHAEESIKLASKCFELLQVVKPQSVRTICEGLAAVIQGDFWVDDVRSKSKRVVSLRQPRKPIEPCMVNDYLQEEEAYRFVI